MKRILFVDDEPKVLDGLKRMLYPLRNEWQMVFVSSGKEALKLLSEAEYDLLVTDVRMSEMSGIELLAEVVKLHPQVVRVVLSGTADQEISLRSVTLAHQYLVKPCDSKTLQATVERAFKLRVVLDNPGLKQLISGIHSLPSMPAAYTRLMEALRAADVSAKEVGRIVAQDMGMTAKVLQMVNSAFFGIRQRITNPVDAVVYLGTETVKALAFAVAAFSQFNAKASGLSIEALQSHSLAVGTLARHIVKTVPGPRTATEDAFVGGLLHDIGKLVLAAHYPEIYREVMRRAAAEGKTERSMEQELFGTTHAEVGAYLLWLWGLPDAVTEVVALHHNPPAEAEREVRPVLAVHVANALVGKHPDEDLNLECLKTLGVANQLPRWKELREEYISE